MPVEGKAELSRIVGGRFQCHTTPSKTKGRINCSFSENNGRWTKLFSRRERLLFKKFCRLELLNYIPDGSSTPGVPAKMLRTMAHLRTRFCRPNVRRMYPENNPNNNLQHSFHHKHKSSPNNGPPRQNPSRSRSIVMQFSTWLKIIREAP